MVDTFQVFKSPFKMCLLGDNLIIADIPNADYISYLTFNFNQTKSEAVSFITKYSVRYAYELKFIDSSSTAIFKCLNFYTRNNIFKITDKTATIDSIIHDFQGQTRPGSFFLDIQSNNVNAFKSVMDKIDQIRIIFEDEFDLIDISDTHILIYIWIDSKEGYYEDEIRPKRFACTYLHKKYFTNLEPNSKWF
jgi:hypothetical protein